jgi:hypothetical protein
VRVEPPRQSVDEGVGARYWGWTYDSPFQQASFSGTRTAFTFQLFIAVTDAWSIGPSQMPWPFTHEYSPPARFTPRSTTRRPRAVNSPLPDTCRAGTALLAASARVVALARVVVPAQTDCASTPTAASKQAQSSPVSTLAVEAMRFGGVGGCVKSAFLRQVRHS